MRVLRNPADVADIKHPGIHRLIRERLAEMKLDEPFDQFGELILVEAGDKPGAIESSSGCWITTGLFGDENFGSPDFMPSFEWLEHHSEHQCYEMLFVMSDDGFGTVLFVPDDADIDPDLLSSVRNGCRIRRSSQSFDPRDQRVIPLGAGTTQRGILDLSGIVPVA